MSRLCSHNICKIEAMPFFNSLQVKTPADKKGPFNDRFGFFVTHQHSFGVTALVSVYNILSSFKDKVNLSEHLFCFLYIGKFLCHLCSMIHTQVLLKAAVLQGVKTKLHEYVSGCHYHSCIVIPWQEARFKLLLEFFPKQPGRRKNPSPYYAEGSGTFQFLHLRINVYGGHHAKVSLMCYVVFFARLINCYHHNQQQWWWNICMPA